MGLQYLMFADGLKEARRSDEFLAELLKIGLLVSDKVDPDTLYPKILDAGTPEADMALQMGEAVEDYSGVEWRSPSDDGGMEKYEQLMAQLEANSQVSFTEVDSDKWGDWQ